MKKLKGGIVVVVLVVSLLIVVAPVSAQPTNVAIFRDNDPMGMGLTSNQDFLTAHGISYTIYDSTQIGTINLSQYDKVIIAGDIFAPMKNAVSANLLWFENYVYNGGILQINGWTQTTQGDSWNLPCGIVSLRFAGETVDIASPGHTILATPNTITDTELDNWNGSYHNYFTSYPTKAKIILREGDTGSAYPVFIITKCGKGCIIASGQTLEYGAYVYSNFLENVILFMCEEDFVNAVAAFMPVKNYHLRMVTACQQCIEESLPDDVPQDVQDLLDEMQAHLDNANMTGNSIYANNELLKALDICDEIAGELGITCNL
jgi:hypothetical protein